MRRGMVGVFAGVLLVGAAGGRLQGGQAPGFPPSPVAPAGGSGSHQPPDPAAARLQEQVEKGRNDDRQKKLVADTARLYELASQLKDQVAKTDKNTLSVDVVKKADEIEKLARSVKEKMRG